MFFTAGFCALLCPAAASAQNQYSFGVEGYSDKYKEETIQRQDKALFGGVTAAYVHSANGYFTSVEGRVAYGSNDYKSNVGKISDIAQYEGELRVLTGISIPIKTIGGVKALVPYLGLGTRYFSDSAKGKVSNAGFIGYDRSIMQLYVPVGMKWEFTSGALTFSPMVEFDALLYGRVNSYLSDRNSTEKDITNQQRKGFGGRGEFMVGQKLEDYSWQIGPYVRYWDIKKSDSKLNPGGATPGPVVEPANTRLQTGAALRVMF